MDISEKLKKIKEINNTIITYEQEQRMIKETIYDELENIVEPIIKKYFKDNPDYQVNIYNNAKQAVSITVFQKRNIPIDFIIELQNILGNGYIYAHENSEESYWDGEADYELVFRK